MSDQNRIDIFCMHLQIVQNQVWKSILPATVQQKGEIVNL